MQLWTNNGAIAANKYTKAAMQIKIMPQFFMRVQILILFKLLEVQGLNICSSWGQKSVAPHIGLYWNKDVGFAEYFPHIK